MQESNEPKINLLVAYPYLKDNVIKQIKDNHQHIRFLLDSGAFTAWKSGNPIGIDDYCRFLDALPITPWRYFALDVIGDPAGTMRNYEIMLKRGYKPIPIFTRGEDVSVLEDYYKTSDVVGIGGLVGTPGNRAFVNGIMKKVGDRRVHWLGFTQLDFVKYYRPYMCDSSAWESGARYARLSLYLGNGKTKEITKMDFIKQPALNIRKAISRLGVDPKELGGESGWSGSRSANRITCARSGLSLSVDVERKIGTKMFLAAAKDLAVSLIIEGRQSLFCGGKK